MNKNKGLLLILSTAIISGFSVFVNKFGVIIVNPYIFTGLKNIIVALLVVTWLLMMKDWKILKKLQKNQWLMLLGIGLIGGSVPFLLFFKGLSMTSGVQAAFIHKTMFIYIIALAAIFLKEKISKNFLIAGLGLFLANILILKIFPSSFGLGDFLILSATIFWALENVLSKYLLKDLSAQIVIWGRMFFGSFFIILFWLITGQAHLVNSLNLEQIGWVMITSVFLFGYVATWYIGLKYVKVSEAAVVLLLASPITAFLSLIFLNEVLLINQFFAIILALLSILIIYSSYAKNKSISAI
ncbi:DMT family transporter [Patescibacteria group bacterium]|nr:DMT family transporter [Patescibacteria group bacterium]